jgi:hypothetical protein
MKNNSISKISMAVTPMMIICGLLALGASAMVQSDELPASEASAGAQSGHRHCSNRTLFGDYGFAVEGLSGPPGESIPLRGLVMSHFDGKGTETQVDHFVVNGTPPPMEWEPGSGPYTVNPDCTGTLVINIPGSPFSPVNLHFVVVRQGKEIFFVDDARPVSSIAIKVE